VSKCPFTPRTLIVSHLDLFNNNTEKLYNWNHFYKKKFQQMNDKNFDSQLETAEDA